MSHRALGERGVPFFLAILLGLSACRRGHTVVVESAPESAPDEKGKQGLPGSSVPSALGGASDLPPFTRLRSTGLEKVTLLTGEVSSVHVACSDGVTSRVSVAVLEGELVLERRAGLGSATCEARVTSGKLASVHTDGSLVMGGDLGAGPRMLVVGGKATVTTTETSAGP
jgi:hypothetical protein